MNQIVKHMKSEKCVYSAPDIEVLEIELEKAVLSGDGNTEGMQDARGGTDWSQYYNYNN